MEVVEEKKRSLENSRSTWRGLRLDPEESCRQPPASAPRSKYLKRDRVVSSAASNSLFSDAIPEHGAHRMLFDRLTTMTQYIFNGKPSSVDHFIKVSSYHTQGCLGT